MLRDARVVAIFFRNENFRNITFVVGAFMNPFDLHRTDRLLKQGYVIKTTGYELDAPFFGEWI